MLFNCVDEDAEDTVCDRRRVCQRHGGDDERVEVDHAATLPGIRNHRPAEPRLGGDVLKAATEE